MIRAKRIFVLGLLLASTASGASARTALDAFDPMLEVAFVSGQWAGFEINPVVKFDSDGRAEMFQGAVR